MFLSRAVCCVAAVFLLEGTAVGAQVTVTPASVGPLTISVPVAGSDVAPVANSIGSYSVRVKVNDINTRIQGQLSAPLPAGMSLAASLAAPAGAVSSGSVVLNAVSPVDLVTAIPKGTNVSGLVITYLYTAPASSGNTAATGITVNFTMSP